MNRRDFLAGLGTAAAVGVAGCPMGGRTTDTPDVTEPDSELLRRLPVEFDSLVNLRDHGAEPSGGRAIDEVLADTVENGTLLSLPPGRYQLEETFSTGVDRFGLVGNGSTIVPPEGYSDTLLGIGAPDPSKAVYVSDLTFDYEADDTGGRPLLAQADDTIVARALTVQGVADVDQDLFRFDVTDPDGSGLVKNLALPSGAPPDTSVTGIEVGDDNRGDIDFVGCYVEGFPDNGLYGDPPEGKVTVLGGTFRNNGVAGVRVEGDEAEVDGVTVRCDTDEDVGENMRGIRLRGGESVLVKNSVVELMEVSTSDGAIEFSSELASGTVRNCRLHVDADGVNAIRVKSNQDETTPGPFHCENVRITGDADEGAGIQAADRSECFFHNMYLQQTGEDRDGIVADNVTGELSDVYIDVTGDPLRFVNSEITRTNVSIDS